MSDLEGQNGRADHRSWRESLALYATGFIGAPFLSLAASRWVISGITRAGCGNGGGHADWLWWPTLALAPLLTWGVSRVTRTSHSQTFAAVAAAALLGVVGLFIGYELWFATTNCQS